MDHSTFASSDTAQHTPQSATSTSTTSSPAVSIFSRGHVSRGSGSTSSIASSPKLRDSFDLFGNSKRLEDVREDPSEREEVDYEFINGDRHYHGKLNLLPQSAKLTRPQATAKGRVPYTLLMTSHHTTPQIQHTIPWATENPGRHHLLIG